MVTLTFTEPIFAFRIEEFGYAGNTSGFVFIALTVPYIAACQFVSQVTEKYSNRGVMIIGFIITGFVGTMFGPSEFLGYPNELWLIILGMAFGGLIAAFTFVPTYMEMLEAS